MSSNFSELFRQASGARSHPARISLSEKLLLLYARRFPISVGKLRVVNALWQYAAGDDTQRVAKLNYGRFEMRCNIREMLQRQFYFFGTYFLERELLGYWCRLAKSSEVILDVGANAGIYSLAAVAANSSAAIHAFEPTPEIAAGLRATCLLNELKAVRVHEKAVSDATGTATLVRCRGGADNDGMNYIRAASLYDEAEIVTVTSLDTFVSATGIERIDLLKIDIQGQEGAAIRGAESLLKNHRIGMIFLELNWAVEGEACSATEAVARLSAHGYQFAVPAAQPRWRVAGEWLRSLSDVMVAPGK